MNVFALHLLATAEIAVSLQFAGTAPVQTSTPVQEVRVLTLQDFEKLGFLIVGGGLSEATILTPRPSPPAW